MSSQICEELESKVNAIFVVIVFGFVYLELRHWACSMLSRPEETYCVLTKEKEICWENAFSILRRNLLDVYILFSAFRFSLTSQRVNIHIHCIIRTSFFPERKIESLHNSQKCQLFDVNERRRHPLTSCKRRPIIILSTYTSNRENRNNKPQLGHPQFHANNILCKRRTVNRRPSKPQIETRQTILSSRKQLHTLNASHSFKHISFIRLRLHSQPHHQQRTRKKRPVSACLALPLVSSIFRFARVWGWFLRIFRAPQSHSFQSSIPSHFTLTLFPLEVKYNKQQKNWAHTEKF